jgi:hypothetical protein
MNVQTKAALESYLRNLLGVVLALLTTTMASAGVSSPLDLAAGDWLLVANGLWAAAVPTLLRYVNKKDPAFGLVAQVAVTAVTKKLEEKIAEVPAKSTPAKPTATKSAPKKPTTKK